MTSAGIASRDRGFFALRLALGRLRHVPPVLGSEGVGQPGTQEIETEQRERERQAGEDHEPRKERQDTSAVGDQRAPGSVRRLYAQPQERQKRLLQDDGGNRQR